MAYKQTITKGSTIRVTAGYPTYPSGGAHGGIDTVHTDLKAYAPEGGKIVTAHVWEGGTAGVDSWGNYIVVLMGDGNYWLAAHFTAQTHNVGEVLNKGDFIGTQGRSGNVTGTHTHWEYWVGGFGTKYRHNPSTILGIPNEVGTFAVEWGGDTPPEPPEPPEPPVPTKKLPIWLYFKLRR